MGFDGSENRDSTALIGWTVAETPHRFTIGLWERPKGVGYEDWHIPRGEVDAAVYRAFRDFKVKFMVCDPAYWHDELTGWDREFGDDVVVKTNTRDNRIMVEAVQRYTVALAEGRFTHDGDPDVQKHIDNMAPRDTRSGIVPIKATRNERIDAGMASLLGFWGLSQVPAAKPRPRVVSLSDVAAELDREEPGSAVRSRPRRRHHVPSGGAARLEATTSLWFVKYREPAAPKVRHRRGCSPFRASCTHWEPMETRRFPKMADLVHSLSMRQRNDSKCPARW